MYTLIDPPILSNFRSYGSVFDDFLGAPNFRAKKNGGFFR